MTKDAPTARSTASPTPFAAILLLLLLCSPIFFFRLGRAGLGDPDEGRNAEVAREMLASGDFVTPRMDGVVYLDKPPLFFWTVALSYAAFGVDEWSARLPSAVAALGGLALVFTFVRRRRGDLEARLAGWTLALTPLYIIFGRLVIFDMLLVLCMTASAFAAFAAMEDSGERSRVPGLLFFAAAGVGTICKGPVALVAPALVALAWGMARGRPRAFLRLRPAAGLLVYAAIVLPWLVLATLRNPGYLHYAIVGENLQRMTSNRFQTARPFYFYAKVLLPGLFPWILPGAASAWRRMRGWRAGRPWAEAWRASRARLAAETDAGRLLPAYAVTWLGVLVVFFSLIASKRPSYMLPCCMPLAILSGQAWAGAFPRRRGAASRGKTGADGVALPDGLTLLAVVCAGMGLAAIGAGPLGLLRGFAGGQFDALLSRGALLGGTGLGLLAAAALLLGSRRSRSGAPAFAACALSIAAVMPLAQAASAYLDEARSSRPLSRHLAARLRPDDVIVCYEQYRPGLSFYLRRPIHLLTTGTPFSSWWVKSHIDEMRGDPRYPILTRDQLRTLLEAPAPGIYIVAPLRMYDRLRADAGEGLRPDPVYEDLGAGLFVRAGPSRLTPATR